MPVVGILALQGDVREHEGALQRIGVETHRVRRAEDVDRIDALVIPGGESTTIGKLASMYGLMDPMRKRIKMGLPTFGTCAGLILLAEDLTEGDQPLLGVLDVTVERNAFGNQNDSFEAHLKVLGWTDPLHAVFIRAPLVVRHGPNIEVLADWNDRPVMIRQDNIIATAFHPELTDDGRVHQMLVGSIEER